MWELPDAFTSDGSSLFILTTLPDMTITCLGSNPNPTSCHSSNLEGLCKADSLLLHGRKGNGEKKDCKSLLVFTLGRKFKQFVKFLWVKKYMNKFPEKKESTVRETWLFLTSHRWWATENFHPALWSLSRDLLGEFHRLLQETRCIEALASQSSVFTGDEDSVESEWKMMLIDCSRFIFARVGIGLLCHPELFSIQPVV